MSQVSPSLRRRLAVLRLVVLDIDGVLTDGTLYYGAAGEQLKSFHARDGLGLHLLQANGIDVAVITARDSLALRRRMEDLKLANVYAGQADKAAALRELMERLSLSANQVAFVGDDVLDLPALRLAGVAVAVGDAHPLVKTEADLVTTAAGGRGAVRELADVIVDSQVGLAEAVAKFLQTRFGDRVLQNL